MGDGDSDVRRRDLLRWLGFAAATLSLPACIPARLAPGRCAPDGAGNIIDVHCHFFNASDVPVEGFVRYVFLGEIREEVIPELAAARAGLSINGLVVFLAKILGAQAPDARSERSRLKKKAPDETPAELDERQTRAVADALVEVDQLRVAAERNPRLMAVDASEFRALLEQVYAEAGVATLRAADAPLTRPNALIVARALKGRDSPIARYIEFARLLLSSREAIAREYIRLYGHERCVRLVTPSFLDMHRWLGRPPRSPIADQVEVMDALQLEIARTTQMRMHSFVGFDPRRAAEDRHVMEVVKHAVHDCGFVGVKLYPPMGFRATGNTDKLEVPKEPKGPGGRRVEAELRKLYDWCARDDVPIMAHAENSLGSNCGYGHRASPVWWRQLLGMEGYHDLRVNLAHFGGFDEALDVGEHAPPQTRCGGDGYKGELWEHIIGKTIRDDRREYLFADLSYLSELATPDPKRDQRREIRDFMADFRLNYDRGVRHLMYGTDWTMTAQEIGNNNYLANLDTQLRLAGYTPDELQNIYWRNAARYLGLGPGGKTRDRLTRYCAKHRIGTEWLEAFDVA